MSTETEQRPISGYELRQAFTALTGLAERVPAYLSRELDQVAEEGFADATSRVNRVLEAVKQFETLLHAKAEEIASLYDSLWNQTKERHEQFRQRVVGLPPIPVVNVPYNLKELIAVAEKCQGLSEVAWQRVVELAKALGAEKKG